MTALSLKWKYASTAAAALLVVMLATAALLRWLDDVDAQHRELIAAEEGRQRVASELQERAGSFALTAAGALDEALSAPDTKPDTEQALVARRLQPLIEHELRLEQLSVTGPAGTTLFEWRRAGSPASPLLVAQASRPAHAPGGEVKVQLAQPLPSSPAQLTATHDSRRDLGTLLAATLAVLGAGAGGLLAWRAARRIEEPLRALIRAGERIGQGDYLRPLAVHRQDVIGELEQALERMRTQLRESTRSRDYLHSVLDSMNDAVFITSPEGLIQVANTAACKLIAASKEEIRGQSMASLLDEREREDFDLERAMQDTRETLLRTRDATSVPVCLSGSRIHSEDPRLVGCIFVARNISERKLAERHIRYLASHDGLTRLPNRMQFQHLLQQAIARAVRSGEALALLYLDIDRFKEINDTFGHASGDRVLEVLTERLTRCLPADTVIGRLAGDELAFFIEGLPLEADNRNPVAHLARSALTEIGRVFQPNEHEVFLTASIGIALCPRDAEDVIDLIRHADAAMYHSKQNGGNTYAFYSPQMNAAAVERLVLKGKLRLALEREELVIRYQPKVDLRDGRIMGAEALLRWRLPGHGDIPPAQFIPLAEETQLIHDIGQWVLARVCMDYRQMQTAGADPGRISLNLSLKQLRPASFILRCRSVFRQYEVSPTAFELEITETTLMADAPRTVRLLEELTAMGLHLSIDDFGTGYSSLSALQQFPIGTLKIDQSFVRNVSEDAGNATIVRTIIEMGRSLGIEVIAEGVESLQQLEFLRRHGCQGAQGRLFGEPLAAQALQALLVGQASGPAPFGSLLRPAGDAAVRSA